MDNKIVVSSIKRLCKSNNITVGELEKTIGLSQGLVSKWLKTTPSLDKIIDIADYFHVPLDEVIGRNQYDISDEFFKSLYEKTSDKSIQWTLGQGLIKQGYAVKLYDRRDRFELYNDDEWEQTAYVTKFNDGYILMYAFHYYSQILEPEELKLFIQPSDESFLVEQYYEQNDLLKLWIKILNNLGDEVPDEIKAEDLKNSFVNEGKNEDKKIIISHINSNSNESTEQIKSTVELLQKPDIQRFLKYMSSIHVQQLINQMDKLQSQDIPEYEPTSELKDSKKNEFDGFENPWKDSFMDNIPEEINFSKKKKSDTMKNQATLTDFLEEDDKKVE